MIAITGDIVDSSHTDIDISIDFVAEISKLCPVYYVSSNHEQWLDESDMKTLLEGLEKYYYGTHRLGDTTMFVSSGLGNSIIPLRLFNYPEIVSIELAKE